MAEPVFKGVYDGTYVIDEGEPCNIGIGFEFDPDNGHIQFLTREAAMKLYVELSRSFPCGEAGTTQVATVVRQA